MRLDKFCRAGRLLSSRYVVSSADWIEFASEFFGKGTAHSALASVQYGVGPVQVHALELVRSRFRKGHRDGAHRGPVRCQGYQGKSPCLAGRGLATSSPGCSRQEGRLHGQGESSEKVLYFVQFAGSSDSWAGGEVVASGGITLRKPEPGLNRQVCKSENCSATL